MSFAQTAALGALAGFTIYLGLPVGRIQILSTRARVGLAMFSVGVLAFIFVDVLSSAFSTVEGAVDRPRREGIGCETKPGVSAKFVPNCTPPK